MGTEHKTCSRCGEAKPRSAFTRHAQKSDGLRPECRECRSAGRKESDAKYRSTDLAKQTRRRWHKHRYETDEGYREKVRARSRAGALRRRQRNLSIIELEAARRGNRCEICGVGPFQRGGEFSWHHRWGEGKSYDIGRTTTHSEARLRAELARCALVCNKPTADGVSCHTLMHRRMRAFAAERQLEERAVAARGSRV